MEDLPVILKGTPQGILLQPKADSWDAVLKALEHALQDAGGFFRGGRVIVELGDRVLSDAVLRSLRQILDRHDLELWAVLGEDEATRRTVRTYGIRTRLPGSAAQSSDAQGEGGEALFLQRTLRSGQRVQFPGHVTLVGDVNPGAEIVAGGNVVVWGKVRGLIHAGAWGDESCVVCGLDLAPSQLRIAGHIGRAPESRRQKILPEVARVEDGQIIAEPWTARG